MANDGSFGARLVSRQAGLYFAAFIILAFACVLIGYRRNLRNEPDAVGGPPVMRRLTELQYRAIVADIWGPDIRIVARFEPGVREQGLVAVGTGEAGMSPVSIEQYKNAALSVSANVFDDAHRRKLAPCTLAPSTHDFNEKCAQLFFEKYGPLLLRRQPTGLDTRRFINAARLGARQLNEFSAGLRFALFGVMMSPEFLLRMEEAVPDARRPGGWQLASASKAMRLSFFLTNSAPDRELLRAAAAGELDTDMGLRRQVDRLISGRRFEGAVQAFFADMLQFDKFNDLDKDPIIYPAFGPAVAADAQSQTLNTLIGLLVKENGDYRDIFTTRSTELTRALGVVYRLPVKPRNGWEHTEFPATSHRTGIQTNIAFLALYAHPGRSSPTLRGKAIREVFLCEDVPDPPPNVNFTTIQDTSNAKMPTARDRLKIHRSQPSCEGCHKVMDPVGLTMENFDGLGTFRSHENGAVIDPSGELNGKAVASPEALGQALHDDPEAPKCLVERMYRYGVGRDTTFEERPYMDYLTASFQNSGYRVPALMRTIALSDEFLAISTPSGVSSDDERAAF